jgi:dCMP deaminase
LFSYYTFAEVNCLLEVTPQERQGATMYVTHAPCPECQKLIITSSIKRVIYCNEYTPAINWFDQAEDIEVEKLQE